MSFASNAEKSQAVRENIEKVKAYLINNISRELEANPPPIDRRREVIDTLLQEVYKNSQINLPETLRAQVFRDILDELLGYGPIQFLLDDPEISEVMVNGPGSVYIERSGKLVKTNVTFQDNDHVTRVIEKIILPLGRRVDGDSPTVDARLPDGSRVNAVIPPVSIDGPSITIRKFTKEKLSVKQLVELR